MCSMYGIFTYIWLIFRANVGRYSIHGAYGENVPNISVDKSKLQSTTIRQSKALENYPFID